MLRHDSRISMISPDLFGVSRSNWIHTTTQTAILVRLILFLISGSIFTCMTSWRQSSSKRMRTRNGKRISLKWFRCPAINSLLKCRSGDSWRPICRLNYCRRALWGSGRELCMWRGIPETSWFRISISINCIELKDTSTISRLSLNTSWKIYVSLNVFFPATDAAHPEFSQRGSPKQI